MNARTPVTVTLAFALSLAPGAAAPGPSREGDGNAARGGPPPVIVNRVLDLLDHTVLLEPDTDHDTWQSREFDTAQFDAIAVKVGSEVSTGTMLCAISWKLGPGDTFLDPLETAPIGVSRLFLRTYFGEEVLGTSAKVFCRPYAWGGPRDPVPLPTSGTLSDVKVLLRRL